MLHFYLGSNVPGGQLYSGGATVPGNLPYPGRNGPVATFASNTYTQSIHSVAAGRGMSIDYF